MQRLVHVLAIVAMLGGAAGAAAAADPTAARPPDLLIVSVDTLRPDALGAYGNESASTPTIDALAARGRRFDNATTPFPRTTPAIATLLTGLWPQHHGSRELGEPIHDVPTLAQTLSARGWATIGVSSTAVLSEREKIDRGFSAFVCDRQPAGRITDMALERLAAVPGSRPVFAWVHYFDPHWPYAPWRDWPDQPRAESCRRLDYEMRQAHSLSYVEVHGNVGGRAGAAVDDCRRLYAAEVAYTDHAVGRLIEGWNARRGDAPTVIVFLADHGEHFGEDGLWYDHGPSLHDAGLRIPLIVVGPGVPAGTTDELPARTEDVVPTVLDLLGVAGDDRPATDGTSLLAGRADRPAAAFAESGSIFDPRFSGWMMSGRGGGVHCINDDRWSLCRSLSSGTTRLFDHRADPLFRTDRLAEQSEVAARLDRAWEAWPPESARRRSARTRHYKLVEYPTLDGGYRRALFDLRRDPAESHDVGGELPAIRDRLGRLLDAWTEHLPRPVMPTERDPEKLEVLRSLGYVE